MQVQLLHSFSAPLFKLAIPWEGEKKKHGPMSKYFLCKEHNPTVVPCISGRH